MTSIRAITGKATRVMARPSIMTGLRLHGVTIHHRRSFAPIRNLLQGIAPSIETPVILAGE